MASAQEALHSSMAGDEAAAAGVVLMLIRPQTRRWGVLIIVVATVVSAPWILISDFAPSRYYLPAVPFVLVAGAYALTLALQTGFKRSVPLGMLALLLALYSGVACLALLLAPDSGVACLALLLALASGVAR